MIKDVMVRLDGSAADHTRLPAAESIADLYYSTIIGLFINIMPNLVPADVGAAAVGTLTLAEKAREAGGSDGGTPRKAARGSLADASSSAASMPSWRTRRILLLARPARPMRSLHCARATRGNSKRP